MCTPHCELERLPLHYSLVGVQEGEIGLTNDHIVWGCVGVKLLVPLLQETLVNALRGENNTRVRYMNDSFG